MPLTTVQQKINTFQRLDELQGISMFHNYISANVMMRKASRLNQLLLNPTHAQGPVQTVCFNLFSPCNQPSFAEHSSCGLFVDDHSHYTQVYTVQNK